MLRLPSVAHKVYGVPQTINSANYVYFLAYQELFALRSGVGVDAPSDNRKRLISFEELDRIVTGELGESIIRFHLSSCRRLQLNFYRYTEGKVLSCSGAILSNVRQKRSTFPW